MGRRGPAPKPTVLRVLEGNPGKRPLNKREPKPRLGAPDCPPWLGADARAFWADLVPRLDRLGLATEVDLGVLAAYCSALADIKWATETIETEGRTFTTADKGYIGPHPAVAILRNARQQIKLLSAELGLSPSARSRISIKSDDVEVDDGILS